MEFWDWDLCSRVREQTWINLNKAGLTSSIHLSRTQAASGIPSSIPGHPFIYGKGGVWGFLGFFWFFWENHPESFCFPLSIQPGILGDHFHGKFPQFRCGIRAGKPRPPKSWQRELFANTWEKPELCAALFGERSQETNKYGKNWDPFPDNSQRL